MNITDQKIGYCGRWGLVLILGWAIAGPVGAMAATKDMALQAGDISHRVLLNPGDARDFLGIDEWQSAEAVQAFSASPQIQEFFSQMFERAPEVVIWEGAGWNDW